MRTNRIWIVVLATLTAWGAAPACGGQTTKGDGSESHFARCEVDADCRDAGPSARCVSGKCEARGAVDGGDAGEVGDAAGPSACEVPTTGAAPYGVTFRFTNRTNQPISVSLGGQCGPQYDVTSCVDGYAHPLTLADQCGQVCPEVPSCVSGACVDEPTSVTAAAPATSEWDGNTYVAHSVAGGGCVDRVAARAGHYRMRVPVYPATLVPNPGGGANWTPLYTVTADFVLPAPGGVVEVPIDRAVADAGPAARDAGACVPLMGRWYRAQNDCYDPPEAIPGFCLRETSPNSTMGTSEIDCFVGRDGTRYAIAKGFTQCVEDDSLLVDAGGPWAVKGWQGLCLQYTSILLTDGAIVTDTACETVIARGNWDTYPFGPQDLTLLPEEAGTHAGECRFGVR